MLKIQESIRSGIYAAQFQRLPVAQTVNDRPEQGSEQVVQREIADVVDTLPHEILQPATEYNQLGVQTALSVRINKLSQVEHAVYAWLTAHRAPDMNAVHGAAAVQHLMDTTKAERHRIVSHSINESRDHEGAGDIPIAGFDTLDHEKKAEVRGLWRGLIERTGRIKITNTNPDTQEVHAGFSMQVLVEFSRLLEGEFGSSMVKDINASEHEIVIEPFTQGGGEHKSFAAGPTAEEHGVDQLIKLAEPPAELQLAHYPQTDITAMNEVQRLQFFNQLKPTQIGQLGVKVVDGHATTYYKFGGGSSVKVTMPSNLPDSSQYKESRLADPHGREIATPVFITLGHELGHGIHMQRGTLTRETDIPRFFGGDMDQRAYLDNREEYVNIEGNENALRAEHGLGVRKGHYNIPYLQKERMMQQLNSWLTWIDNLGGLKTLPVYRDIDRWITDVSTRVYTKWDQPDQLETIKVDFAALPARVRNAQFDYLQDNFNNHLNHESVNLSSVLSKLKFSFNTAMDIPYIALALDMEFDLEKVQARDAVAGDRLANYLQALPAQRLDYVRVKIAPKVSSIGQMVNPHVNANDQREFLKLQQALHNFETMSWLFPG